MIEALAVTGIYACISLLFAGVIGVIGWIVRKCDNAPSTGEPDSLGCEAEGVAVHDERNAA